MTPLIITLALIAIAAAGAWSLIRHNRGRKFWEQRARGENERLASETRLAHEEAMAEANALDDARLQAEAEERSRNEAEATENARLAEEQRLAVQKRDAEAEAKRLAEEIAFAESQAREAAHLKAVAEAKQQAEAEAREKARLAVEEEQRAEERRQAEERERARIGAEEVARRQAEHMAEEENTASEPVVEATSQDTEAEAEVPAAQVPGNESQLLPTDESEPPLAEADQLSKAREFSEPKPSPIRKTSTKRKPKPDSIPRTEVTSPIRLQLVFGRGGSVKTLALVPHRRGGMPSNIEVTTANGRLRLAEWSADSYEPVPVCDVPNALSEGVVFQARCGAQRWRWELSRRELYVLAAGELRGFVTRRKDQRLWLNSPHVVLAKDSLRGQVLAALSEAGCATPEVNDSTTPGVPSGWILFRDVKPTRAVPMRDEGDLNVLCPAHEIEPQFVGGIRLERNVWLAGFPPRIRFTGEMGSGFQVLIDEQPAQLASDGAFESPGWNAEGEHRLWFGDQAETYSLRTVEEGWERWHAHDFGTGAAICGASTHRTDGARWRQVRIPMANPLLVGARPGEIFRCQSRPDVRSEEILALVPFAPAWALPIDPAHADKRSVRLVALDSLEPSVPAEQLSRNHNSNRTLKQWIAAINDAGRKQLALAVDDEDSKVLWRRYRAVAKQLWKRMR